MTATGIDAELTTEEDFGRNLCWKRLSKVHTRGLPVQPAVQHQMRGELRNIITGNIILNHQACSYITIGSQKDCNLQISALAPGRSIRLVRNDGPKRLGASHHKFHHPEASCKTSQSLHLALYKWGGARTIV